MLGSGAQTRTADDGSNRFDQVATGVELVSLDVSQLSTRYLVPSETRFRIHLHPRENQRLHLPIQPAAGVAGRVVLRDSHGTVGVPDVLVRIKGTHHDVFTDEEGRFVIHGLDARTRVVEIVEWTLGDGFGPAGELPRQVTLEPGRTVTLPEFLLEKKELPVLQHFQARR